MIVCHILIISLFIIYASWFLDYLDSQNIPSNDVNDKIQSEIKRLSREAGISENEVKQKTLARKQLNLGNSIMIKTTGRFK